MHHPPASPTESDLLAEVVDLDRDEKHRILTVWRAIESGEVRRLFDLPSGASQRELKRVYYELSRQFHPDRFHGRTLGSFEPLLGRILQSLAAYVKMLNDPRTVIPERARTVSTRARRHERFPLVVPVALRARSRGVIERRETIDVGLGGLFVATADPAPAGDVVELRIMADGAIPAALSGKVVHSCDAAQAQARGGAAGMGIEIALDRQAGEAAAHAMLELVVRAQSAATVASAPPPPQRRVRGTDSAPSGSRIIGIDFGTSFTSVTAAVGRQVKILRWPDGGFAAPSVVAFPEEGGWEVGAAARDRLARDPRHAIAGIKRLLGRTAEDPELASHLARAPYPIGTGPDGHLTVEMRGRIYEVPQLISLVLHAARRVAAGALGGDVKQAVATVPVSFGDERVALLRRAGRLAGLEIVEIIEEPSAAALACRRSDEADGLVGVYDFGGGTFDFSVVDASAGKFSVLATAGDSWLGGIDLDVTLAEAVARQLERRHGIDLRRRPVEWQTLLDAVEKAKRELSDLYSVELVVPGIVPSADGPRELRVELRRDLVEPLWKRSIDRSIDTCSQALELIDVAPDTLQAIYLSGGTSYVPAIRRAIATRLGVPVKVGAPPEHAVCLGAGILAAQLGRWAERGRAVA